MPTRWAVRTRCACSAGTPTHHAGHVQQRAHRGEAGRALAAVRGAGLPTHTWPTASSWPARGEIADFDDTAAAIANLDVIVTCGTAIAHLPGAMGRPTFVVPPHTPTGATACTPNAAHGGRAVRLLRQSRRATGPACSRACGMSWGWPRPVRRRTLRPSPLLDIDPPERRCANHGRASRLPSSNRKDREIDPRMKNCQDLPARRPAPAGSHWPGGKGGSRAASSSTPLPDP
ncbi:MAG TPA: hypothetical protein VIP05_00225 [Burkholderiaceae bacterium]